MIRFLFTRYIPGISWKAKKSVNDFYGTYVKHARNSYWIIMPWMKKYSHSHNLGLSIEPYDMNPTADLELGSVADIPMGEFWSKGFGFNTSSFSCLEALQLLILRRKCCAGRSIYFRIELKHGKQYPGSMKNQGDWAFATGINRFFYHTFDHKPLDE